MITMLRLMRSVPDSHHKEDSFDQVGVPTALSMTLQNDTFIRLKKLWRISEVLL